MEKKDLLELVWEKENGAFTQWVRARLCESGLDVDLTEYWVGALMLFLGVSHRAYTYWEKMDGYPVPEPVRKTPYGGRGSEARVYTPDQVVQIAWWFYCRKVKKQDDQESDVRSPAECEAVGVRPNGESG